MSQDKDHSQARASASYSARLRGGAISRGLTWLLQLGTSGYDPATRHRLMIMNAIAYLIAFTTAGYAVQHAQFDYNKFEPIILLNVALVAVALLVPLSHRVSDIAGGLVIVVTEWVALLLFTMYLGRHAGLHLQYFAGAAAPFVVFGLNRIRLVLLTVVSGLALHIYAWFSFPPGRALIDAGDDVLNPLYYQAAISTAVLIAATVWYAFRLAEDAKAETDALLRNILPDSIVERLKARPDAVIADTHANVTVMFADISGFVALSRKLGPDRVVDLLNDIVRQFDRLAVHHGIEKIKTIGDAYMAVAGVPQPCADAAQRSVTMARDMMKVIADVREAQSVDLHIRVGLASGPVLAGVIGTQKFSYDVWGDTVNLASRMEGASERGRILICPATHEQLGDVFALEEREPIEIKGVGPLKTWFVAESRSAAPVS
ncbi:MAG: adenylate/guanylate cyclase domain-containing protein [Hyphomicrobiaceae bacterium]